MAEYTSAPTVTRRKTFTKTLIDTTNINLNVVLSCQMVIKKEQKQMKQISIEDGSEIVAKELCDEWIQRNVYPMHENNVAKKIKSYYERFKIMSNQFTSEWYRKTQNWYKRAINFKKYMTNHEYDIRTKRWPWYQAKLEDQYGVKMSEEDELF